MFCATNCGDKPLNDEELLLHDVKTIVASSAPDEIKGQIIREMLLIFAEKTASASKGFHQRVSDAMAFPKKQEHKNSGWLGHLMSK